MKIKIYLVSFLILAILLMSGNCFSQVTKKVGENYTAKVFANLNSILALGCKVVIADSTIGEITSVSNENTLFDQAPINHKKGFANIGFANGSRLVTQDAAALANVIIVAKKKGTTKISITNQSAAKNATEAAKTVSVLTNPTDILVQELAIDNSRAEFYFTVE